MYGALDANAQIQQTLKIFGDLDRMLNYEFYFPEYNAPEIVKKFNLFIAKINSKLLKKKAKNNNSHAFRKSFTIATKLKDNKS